MGVEAGACSEGDDGNGHGHCGDGKTDGPADAVLDIDHHSHRQAAAPVDGKVEPVEEGLLLQAILQRDTTISDSVPS